jgi:hypothetical protein
LKSNLKSFAKPHHQPETFESSFFWKPLRLVIPQKPPTQTATAMLSPGAIAGIVIGSIIGLMIVIWLSYRIWYRRTRQQNTYAPGVENLYYPPYSPTLSHPAAELQEWEPQQYVPSHPPDEPVNHGSMQVKGIAEVRGGRERVY